MDDFVEMKHPNLPDSAPSRVHPSSFETVWKKRGWVLTSTPEAKAEVRPFEAPKPPARPASRPAEDKE